MTTGKKPTARRRRTPAELPALPGRDGVAVVAMPSKGPGRKRYVPADSLDGLSARLANELAVEFVGRVRQMADQMLDAALAKINRKA